MATGGRIYLELEDSRGMSLADWLSRREFSHLELVELLIQLTQPLQSLHSRGIVHNDVKPQTGFGSVVLSWAPPRNFDPPHPRAKIAAAASLLKSRREAAIHTP